MGSRFSLVPAAYVYLLDGRRVLLQKRRDTGHMDGFWVAGAAGHIEAQETAAACAVRESAEELGVEISESDVAPLTVMQRTGGTHNPIEQRVDWYFTARSWRCEPRVMEPERCTLDWHDGEQLPAPIPPYEEHVLQGLAVGRLDVFTAYGFR